MDGNFQKMASKFNFAGISCQPLQAAGFNLLIPRALPWAVAL
jgi:hypothetical protein